MSPTSCRCSTPRRVLAIGYGLSSWLSARSASRRLDSEGGGCPRRPRLPWGRPHSTLRRCAGSRPGSGWDRVGPARSRPRAPPTPGTPGTRRPVVCASAAGCAPATLLSGRPRALPSTTHANTHRFRSAARRGGTRPLPEEASSPPPGAGRPAAASTTPDWMRRCEGIRPRPLGRLGSSRLPAVHLPPINPVICRGSYLITSGDARLGEGFPLRCFQRFARPHVATQRCRLRDNWHTSGASTPVLSY